MKLRSCRRARHAAARTGCECAGCRRRAPNLPVRVVDRGAVVIGSFCPLRDDLRAFANEVARRRYFDRRWRGRPTRQCGRRVGNHEWLCCERRAARFCPRMRRIWGHPCTSGRTVCGRAQAVRSVKEGHGRKREAARAERDRKERSDVRAELPAADRAGNRGLDDRVCDGRERDARRRARRGDASLRRWSSVSDNVIASTSATPASALDASRPLRPM